jgi:hypothetical protein
MSFDVHFLLPEPGESLHSAMARQFSAMVRQDEAGEAPAALDEADLTRWDTVPGQRVGPAARCGNVPG